MHKNSLNDLPGAETGVVRGIASSRVEDVVVSLVLFVEAGLGPLISTYLPASNL